MTAKTDVAAVLARMTAHGARFEQPGPADLRALRAELSELPAEHPYFELIEHYGFLQIPLFSVLSPSLIRREREKQQTFFKGASFGKRPEDEANLVREQAFRSTLIPFQYAGTKVDFFCFVMCNVTRAGPLIVDVCHDDHELVRSDDALTNPKRKTVYTRSLARHLAWVASLIEESSTRYPPI